MYNYFPIVGNDVPEETVDSAAVFLFNLFLKDQTWSRSHSEEIKRELGPFPASAASNACAIVKRIVALLPEGWRSKAEQEDDKFSKPVNEFGHNIVFNYTEFKKPVRDLGSVSQRNSSGYDSLSDDEAESQKSELISGLFLDTNSTSGPPPISKQAAPAVGEPEAKYTRGWLKSQCQSCSKDNSNGGLQWQELYSAVFDLLSSSEDNSGIENNVSVVNTV